MAGRKERAARAGRAPVRTGQLLLRRENAAMDAAAPDVTQLQTAQRCNARLWPLQLCSRAKDEQKSKCRQELRVYRSAQKQRRAWIEWRCRGAGHAMETRQSRKFRQRTDVGGWEGRRLMSCSSDDVAMDYSASLAAASYSKAKNEQNPKTLSRAASLQVRQQERTSQAIKSRTTCWHQIPGAAHSVGRRSRLRRLGVHDQHRSAPLQWFAAARVGSGVAASACGTPPASAGGSARIGHAGP
ncbi:hypothetical protein CALVIDRAFT_254866 [Calocera viscosa TUFC12733]|uniref:Uncharacterized protein n=1 Tax=Calocera viscosa (strain TUFC12733) TaxID=1330018 RepID=A0A167J8E0_CALVF|nr:hypothetical protein CALVIDRAFT_254866 [Calocera viscosa TUFC12733]